jgi:hypothetical protein
MLESFNRAYDPPRVFLDFLEMSAIAISNAVDLRQRPDRENRYLALIKQYAALEDRQAFPAMLAELVNALEKTGKDVLGRLSEWLGMTSYRSGQFWTPWEVSSMMARMVLADPEKTLAKKIKDQGFITAAEPCCGPGGMILAFAEAFKDEGYNPAQQLHFQAVDISPYCVHMSYIQTSLCGIPAIVSLGNSLTDKFTEHWLTPAHVFGGFSYRLRKMGIDHENAAWWAKTSVPERIKFLQANGLEVKHSVANEAARAVLDAKDKADREAASAELETTLEETAD